MHSGTYTSNSQLCITAATGEVAEVNGEIANISGSYNVLTATVDSNAFHSATYQTADSTLRMTRKQSSTPGESNLIIIFQNLPFN